MKNEDSKYVIQRTDNSNGEEAYLSPGRVNWVPECDHKKYGTRYGKWLLGEAEEMSSKLNLDQHPDKPYYSFAPLPERNHK